MIEVLSPGALTTVQDLGRIGYAAFGVAPCGVADRYSLQVANCLVGNSADAAALEITLAGPTLLLHRSARIALCGSDIDARCGDVALAGWRRIDLPADSQLTLGGCRSGARVVLAIAGGIDTPPVLGSRATDLRAGFGGLDGRALRRGDRLPVGDARAEEFHSLTMGTRWFDPSPTLQRRRRDRDDPETLRLLAGADALADARSLEHSDWQVDVRLNRQGIRLTGPILSVVDDSERVSQPVTPGTIQLPPDGQPIVLGVDAQTVGGYPCVGHVIRADWPRLAQLSAGDAVRFDVVSEQRAEQFARQQHHVLQRLALANGRDSIKRQALAD